MTIIISADELKKSLPGYNPKEAEKFHHASARLADKEFEHALKSPEYTQVIILNGGAASGKTEFLLTHLSTSPAIILDTTLSTVAGIEIKLKKIIKAKKKLEIYSIIPDDLTRAFIAFLHRDRKFRDDHFYRTHSGARITLQWIATHHPEINVHLIESSYTKSQKMQFAEIKFESRKQCLQYLQQIQISENDIISIVNKLLLE